MATETHLEIEAKYDLAVGQPLPDLVGVAGVTEVVGGPEQLLVATYLDTEDLALLRNGATLRRREGGTDEGWHLKLRVGDRERLELRRPLGRPTAAPRPLTELLTGLLRGADLRPVATLRTTRTVHRLVDHDGSVLAEVADDVVSADNHLRGEGAVWRELEVELVDAPPELLTDLDAAVVAAGVPRSASESKVGRVLAAPDVALVRLRRRSTMGEVARAAVRELSAELLANDPLLRLDREGAADRQLSILTKLQAALDLLDMERSDSGIAATKGRLERALATVAGLARHDAAVATILAMLADEPRHLVMGPVRRRLDRELTAVRRTAVARVREMVDSPRYLTLLDGLASHGSEPPEGPTGTGGGDRAGKLLPDLARKHGRQLERRLKRLRRAETRDQQDAAADVAADAVAALMLADDLGRLTGHGHRVRRSLLAETSEQLQQLAVARHAQDLLREVGVQAHLAGENAFALGRLHGLAEGRAARSRRSLWRARRRLRAERRAS